MRRIPLLAASILLAAGAPLLALAGPANAATGDVTCANGFLGVLNVVHNLTVPADSSCGLTQGSTIGNDVIVDPGASFYIGGTTIGHNLTATDATLIELGDPNNGTTETVIDNDATITGTVGGLPYGEFICQTQIDHNLSVTDTASTASGWDIGAPEPANCGRNSTPGDIIGNNATFTNNEGAYLDVGSNQVGYNLSFKGNVEGFNDLTNNTIANSCSQNYNHPFSGSGNTAGNNIDTCNSSNS
jgi:hypothetical protein